MRQSPRQPTPRVTSIQRPTRPRQEPSPITAPVAVRSVAAVRTPISVPSRRETAAHHRAGDIARARRGAKGGGARAAGPAARHTAHGRAANENVSRPVSPLRFAKQAGEMITRGDRVGLRARMARTATPVHLARRDARETDVRAFGAPDRPVAIPDRDRRASEDLAGRDDRGEKEQAEHHPPLIPTPGRFKCPDSPTRQVAARSADRRRALGEPAAGWRARGSGGLPPPARTASQVRCAAPDDVRSLAPPAGPLNRAALDPAATTWFSPYSE